MASARVDDDDKMGGGGGLCVSPASSRASLFSKIDPSACAPAPLTAASLLRAGNGACAPAPSAASLLRGGNGGLLKSEKCSGEQPAAGEPAAKPKQGTLMKKLSWLISPKKKPSKASSRKQPLPQDGGRDGKDHFELLFAHAEATLGELLVRAGASFSARSTAQEESHLLRPQDCAQSNSSHHSSTLKLGGSFGRTNAEAGQAHLRRNSLSRMWQQVGGNLFCGSAHLNVLAMEEMELRGISPMPQAHRPTAYSGEATDGEMVADELYWQSLAESILMQRQKAIDGDQQHDEQCDVATEPQAKDSMPGASGNFSAISESTSQHMQIASREVSAECSVSEILTVHSGPEVLDVAEATLRSCATCGTAGCTLEDKHNELLVPREVGNGCTRLNTLLDASPNLAHNYQIHMKRGADTGATSSSGSRSVVELLNYYSRPSPSLSISDQGVVPLLFEGATSSGSTACASSSKDEGIDQPHENSEFNEIKSEALADMDPSDTPESEDLRAQNQSESATNSIRVSLMALLHEEAAGVVESAEAALCVQDYGDQVQALAPQEEEGLVGEEPLALYCCVCMVRRKGAALIPCGHTFCRICSKQLFADRGACPLCNNLIVQLLDIF